MQPKSLIVMSIKALICFVLIQFGLVEADTFEIEPSPEPANAETMILTAVEVVAPDDIWAVGLWRRPVSQFDSHEMSLALHYDGEQWSIVDSPSPADKIGDVAVDLADVDAVAANEVYAVGIWNRFANSAEAFLIEWNGSNWEQIFVVDENDIPLAPVTEAVAALDSKNVWLGGQGYSPGVPPAMLIRYDGSGFERFDLPLVNNGAHRIRDISILNADDIWAVGGAGGETSAIGRNLVGHWHGSSFDLVSTPQYGIAENLNAVAAVSTNDVWASGVFHDINTGKMTPLFMHWDGSSWTRFDSPAFANDLVAISSNSINGVNEDQIVHWNGTKWQIVADLGLPSFQGQLRGIDSINENEFVTAGSFDFNRETLIARFINDSVVLGDVSGDGVVDLLDVAPFIDLLSRSEHQVEADIDGDGVVNLLDVDGFIQLLSGN